MSTKTLSIAVVAPDYEHLTITLDSIIKQTYKDIIITVIHDLSDRNITGIIRHYPQPMRSLDIQAPDSVKKTTMFGDYHCRLNSGDVLSQQFAEDAMRALTNGTTTLFVARAAVLDEDGNVVRQPDDRANKYALLATALANRTPADGICITGRKKGKASIANLQFSDHISAGIRQNRPGHNATKQLSSRVLAANATTILNSLAAASDHITAANIFVKMIKTSLKGRYFFHAPRLITSSVLRPGYRRPIVRSIIKPHN